jgi:hypothetical protein
VIDRIRAIALGTKVDGNALTGVREMTVDEIDEFSASEAKKDSRWPEPDLGDVRH